MLSSPRSVFRVQPCAAWRRLLLGAAWLLAAPLFAAEVAVHDETAAAPVRYALEKLTAALAGRGDTVATRTLADGSAIVVRADAAESGPDGFALERTGRTLTVRGGDARGAMYGVLDVAAQLRLGTALDAIAPRTVRARFPFRAIKFNLPFAGYRNSPAIEQHQDVVRDLAFWTAFLDMMAENRFNTLTLWSLHPFHYLVVPKSFPEAQTFSNEELAGWRRFYTQLFAMARQRGIETYLINWNTFVSPAFARAHGIAEHSLEWDFKGDGPKDRIVQDYTRECVQQTIDEYPDLTGLGITFGERMGGQTPTERRQWMEDSFFAGIQAAHRPIKFIYRAPLSADTRIGGSTSVENDALSRAQVENLGGNVQTPVYVEFKFNWSHGHSSSRLHIVHGGPLSDAYWNPLPKNYQPVWTVRNEDFLILRWGEPNFVREFIANNGQPYVGGALLGSECFIPAKDSISLDGPWKSGRYAFERQWLWYALWGRLLHEPETPDAYFAAQLGARFGTAQGSDLLAAWTLAGRVPLRFAAFHRGTVDRSLYTEGFSRWEDGGDMQFFDIDEFIDHPVLDPVYVNIRDFVAASATVKPGQTSPLQLAAILDEECTAAAAKVAAVRTRGAVSPKLDAELADLDAWVAYGRYFAAKLRGGVALATYRATRDPAQQERAIAELTAGIAHWRQLADAGARFNKSNVLFGTSVPMSWRRLLPAVEHDLELARAAIPAEGKK